MSMFEVLYYLSVVVCFVTAGVVAISTFKFFMENIKAKKNIEIVEDKVVNQ